MKSVCFAIALLGLVAVSGFEKVTDLEGLKDIREVSASLFLSNPFDAGSWGPINLCNDGSHVHAFEILFYPPGAIDETALNAVKLYCSTEGGHDDGYLTSASGPEGVWYGMRICVNDFLTGFRGRVLEYQGVFTDDVAVHDFEAECDYGAEILPGIEGATGKNNTPRFNLGDWSVWTQCPEGSAVCGLQTRVERPQIADDDTAVTDITLYCCPRVAVNGTVFNSDL